MQAFLLTELQDGVNILHFLLHHKQLRSENKTTDRLEEDLYIQLGKPEKTKIKKEQRKIG